MLKRLETDVLSLRPGAVIILAGSNDALGLREITTWNRTQETLQQIAQRIVATGAKVVFVLPPPADEPLAEARLQVQRKWLQEEATRQGYGLLDFYTPLVVEGGLGIKPNLTVDGLHPNKSGYEVLAQAAIAGLRQINLINEDHKNN